VTLGSVRLKQKDDHKAGHSSYRVPVAGLWDCILCSHVPALLSLNWLAMHWTYYVCSYFMWLSFVWICIYIHLFALVVCTAWTCVVMSSVCACLQHSCWASCVVIETKVIAWLDVSQHILYVPYALPKSMWNPLWWYLFRKLCHYLSLSAILRMHACSHGPSWCKMSFVYRAMKRRGHPTWWESNMITEDITLCKTFNLYGFRLHKNDHTKCIIDVELVRIVWRYV